MKTKPVIFPRHLVPTPAATLAPVPYPKPQAKSLDIRKEEI